MTAHSFCESHPLIDSPHEYIICLRRVFVTPDNYLIKGCYVVYGAVGIDPIYLGFIVHRCWFFDHSIVCIGLFALYGHDSSVANWDLDFFSLQSSPPKVRLRMAICCVYISR